MSSKAFMPPIRISIASVGIVGPGLHGWQNSKKYLRQQISPESQELPSLVPAGVSSRERRRLTENIKFAMVAAQDALDNLFAPLAIEELSTVFTSADGDLFVADKILTALTLSGKPVSPTHFHNSVHNAPAGYWHLASHSMHASTSIAGGADSFSSALLEAVSQVSFSNEPCLLVACDAHPPQSYKQQIEPFDSLALAIVLQAANGVGLNTECDILVISAAPRNAEPTTMADAGLEQLRRTNPAARALPLLHLLANPQKDSVILSGGLANGIEVRRVDNSG